MSVEHTSGTSRSPLHVSAAKEREFLEHSVHGLRRAAPHMSAHMVLSRGQQVVAVLLLFGLAATLAIVPATTAEVSIAVATVAYGISLLYRLVLVRRGMHGDQLIRVSDQDAIAVPAGELPVYSVLVPAYREPEIIGKVIAALSSLDYPADKLDVRLLLEADDEETINAANAIGSLLPITVVLVPPAHPRTKPKACNFGLHTVAGEYVTIFDAEDRPEPLQLRRAVVALRRLGTDYACVQAQLGYFNASQNVITRWFAVEYGTWFRFLLPGLVAVGAPVPLGGTSNHFRADILRDVGAWDAYNVTEDADLGIRLARLGYHVGVLESVTLEEANSDFVNWIKQRSRWYKGYLQTWLVHMRNPRQVQRELGWRGTAGLHLFIAGTPLMALLNPVFWALSLMWFAQEPHWIHTLFPSWVFYVGLSSFILGNAAVVYMNILSTRVMDEPGLLGAAVVVPLYWVMMSTAAIKAMFQLIRSPFYWEKTSHGLDSNPVAEPLDDIVGVGVAS